MPARRTAAGGHCASQFRNSGQDPQRQAAFGDHDLYRGSRDARQCQRSVRHRRRSRRFPQNVEDHAAAKHCRGGRGDEEGRGVGLQSDRREVAPGSGKVAGGAGDLVACQHPGNAPLWFVARAVKPAEPADSSRLFFRHVVRPHLFFEPSPVRPHVIFKPHGGRGAFCHLGPLKRPL